MDAAISFDDLQAWVDQALVEVRAAHPHLVAIDNYLALALAVKRALPEVEFVEIEAIVPPLPQPAGKVAIDLDTPREVYHLARHQGRFIGLKGEFDREHVERIHYTLHRNKARALAAALDLNPPFPAPTIVVEYRTADAASQEYAASWEPDAEYFYQALQARVQAHHAAGHLHAATVDIDDTTPPARRGL